MKNATFQWKKTVPTGSIEQSNLTVTNESMARTLDIYLSPADLRYAIRYILGSSFVVPAVAAQGGSPATPAKLSRTLPAQHPDFPWLRATKILSCSGLAAASKTTLPAAANSVNGEWKKLKMTILFERIPYPLLTDNVTTAEYQRWCLFSYDGDVEIQARKGELWGYLAAAARNTMVASGLFPGDLLLRTFTGILRIQWFDVPEEWLYLGQMIPSNFAQAMGMVNLFPFPRMTNPANSPWAVDQNTGQPIRLGPGTLLLMKPKIKRRQLMHPEVLFGQQGPEKSPRGFDVEIEMLHFNPPTDDTTQVRTNGQNVLVRGHNLTAMPKVSASNFRYYAVGRCSAGFTVPPLLNNAPYNNAGSNIIASDASLAYPYSDFEKLFGPPQSLPNNN